MQPELPSHGVVYGLPDEAYHAHNSISKSGLWTIYTKTPAHFRYGEREEKSHFTLGKGAHCAILEPAHFEARYFRGPEDRRGNKWKDAEFQAEHAGKILMTVGDYDDAMRIRDAAARNSIVRLFQGGDTVAEASAFWIDPENTESCRCRPDAYSRKHRIIGDLKTTTDASPAAFARSIADYGYHVQEAMYSDGWISAGGGDVEGFVFMAIEKTAPYAIGVYELPPAFVTEGHAIYRKALATYAACVKNERRAILAAKDTGISLAHCWPAYGDKVQSLEFKRWHYRETNAPEGLE